MSKVYCPKQSIKIELDECNSKPHCELCYRWRRFRMADLDSIIIGQERYMRELLRVDRERELFIQYEQFITGGRKWYPYYHREQYTPFDYTSVRLNEVILEIDTEHWGLCCDITNMLQDVLKDYHIPNKLYGSGGKGTHTHIFLNLEPDITDDAQFVTGVEGLYNLTTWKFIRYGIFLWVCELAGIPKEHIGAGKKVDAHKVLWSDTTPYGSLIRAPGGFKRYYKTVLHHCSVEYESLYEHPPVFPDGIEMWKPDYDILKEACELAIKTGQTIKAPLSCDGCSIEREGTDRLWLGCKLCGRKY